jgi:predicted nucleic acid-binding protein
VNVVFLDTIGFIALWDDADQWHDDAQRSYDTLRCTRFTGVSTDAVLLECGNAASRRPYRNQVNPLRQQLDSAGRLVKVTDRDWEQAWQAYDRNEAGNASIVDHVSFVVMRRLGITRAFTNDRHFKAAGFETLF